MPASRGGLRRSASPIAFGSAYGRPSGRVVQVVELPHRGDAGQRHLGVRRAGQGEVGVRVEPSRRAAYIRSRQVQNVPPPAWVRPRSARWKAWLWHVGEAGQHDAGQPVGAGRGRRPASTAVNRPSVDLEPRRRARGRPAAARAAANHASSRPARASDAWSSASTPARQSSRSACSAGECETPVGLRTNSIAVGMPAAAEDAGVVAGAGVEHGGAPSSSADSRVAQRARRSVVAPVQDSSTSVAADARPPRVDVGDDGPHLRRLAGPRASSQAVTCEGIALTPLGSTSHLAAGGDAAVAARPPARAASTTVAQREHRVVPVGQPRWSRRGWPRRAGRSASGRAARSRCRRRPARSRSIRPRPCSTCSSTKVPIRRSVSSSRPSASASMPGRGHRLGQRARRRRRQRAGAVGGQRAGDAGASRRRRRRTARPPRRRS